MAGQKLIWIQRIFQREGQTPLPTKVLAILFFIMLINGMTSTMCFSYLPKMVKSFGFSEVEAGRYAGFIASSVYVGYILFSLVWGYLGDTKGNKFAIILSISGMTLTTLAFGFSTSFYWALISRLLQGCCMGFVVICKSILAHFLDETNTNLGFSIFFSCWTIAFVIGPSTAGFLVYPADQYPNVFSRDSIFGKFGVLLPNLLLVICNVIMLIVTIIFLPDEKKCKNSEGKYLLSNHDIPNYTNLTEMEKHDDNRSNYLPVNYNRKVEKMSFDGKEWDVQVAFFTKNTRVIPVGVLKVMQLFKLSDFVIAVIAYGWLGLSIIGVEEMFPLYSATSTYYHGLDFSTSQIGTVLFISSVFLLIVQVTVTTRVSNRYGQRKTFIGAALLPVFMLPMFPVLGCIKNSILLHVSTTVVMVVNQVAINGTMVTLNILLNNTVTPELYGCANGIGVTVSSIGRIAATGIFGNLYSWSLSNVKGVDGNQHALGFPFNQFFVFYVGALAFVTCAVAVSALSPNVDIEHIRSVEEKTAIS